MGWICVLCDLCHLLAGHVTRSRSELLVCLDLAACCCALVGLIAVVSDPNNRPQGGWHSRHASQDLAALSREHGKVSLPRHLCCMLSRSRSSSTRCDSSASLVAELTHSPKKKITCFLDPSSELPLPHRTRPCPPASNWPCGSSSESAREAEALGPLKSTGRAERSSVCMFSEPSEFWNKCRDLTGSGTHPGHAGHAGHAGTGAKACGCGLHALGASETRAGASGAAVLAPSSRQSGIRPRKVLLLLGLGQVPPGVSAALI